jgi:hypothetical protein
VSGKPLHACVIATVVCILVAVGPPRRIHGDDGTKLPAPSKADRDAAVKLIKEVFHDAYEKADSQDTKSQLAKDLLRFARQEASDPKNRFWLLTESVRIAIEARDLPTALAAVDEMDRRYVISASRIKGWVQSKVARQAINVLKMIDPQQDAIKGTWRFEQDALLCKREANSRIHIPYIPPEEYAIEIVVTQKERAKSFFIGLVGSGGVVTVVLDHEYGTDYGLSLVDGKKVGADNPTTREGKVFEEGEASKIVCHVHKNGIRVTVDGEMLIDWEEGFERLSVEGAWAPKDRRLPYFGSHECIYAIHSVKLLPISGPGQPLRPLNGR